MDGQHEQSSDPRRKNLSFPTSRELSLPPNDLKEKLVREYGFSVMKIYHTANVRIDEGDGTRRAKFSLDERGNETSTGLHFTRKELGNLILWKLKNNLAPQQNITVKNSQTFILHPEGDINLTNKDVLTTENYMIVLFFGPESGNEIEMYYSVLSARNVL